MSMQPRPEVPVETSRVVGKAFPKGTLPIRVRDQLGSWYDDEVFTVAYGVRGRPGISPAQLAMVTVLQFTGNLTDRQAADAVRGRLDWKYCLGLALEDEGFDFSVLSEFRARLVAGGVELAVLDLLLDRLKGLGLVQAGGRQRTDSTHVLGRIRDLNRLELAGESVRAALEALSAAAPDWLVGVIDDSWQQVYGQRIDNLRLPESETRCTALAVQYGRDGYHLLEAVGAPGAPSWLAELPTVGALRRIWVQQYYRVIDEHGEKVVRREASEHGLPPGRLRLVSVYDTDARYSEKRGKGWLGYKVHFSETCSEAADDDPATGLPEAPNLITNVATTDASVPDVAMTAPIHDMTLARDLAQTSTSWTPATPARTCCWPHAPGESPCSARCSPTPHPRPAPAGTPLRRSPPTGNTTRSPARREPPASRGARAASGEPRRPWSGSPRPPARHARPRTGAPAHRARAANCPCARARSTTPWWPPAPDRTANSGRTGTRSASTWRAPCARPPTSPASAAHAGQDPAGALCRRCIGQPDPAGRLVEQQTSRQDPDQPPATAQFHPRHLNPNKPTGSLRIGKTYGSRHPPT